MPRPTGEATNAHKRNIAAALRAINHGEARLAQAVRDANTDGASIRVLAELTGRGTGTIQKWIREGGE